jgi:hypothetical protein
MRANTKNGDETCNYFIKVESLIITMSKYLVEKIKNETKEWLLLKDREIKKNRRKNEMK